MPLWSTSHSPGTEGFYEWYIKPFPPYLIDDSMLGPDAVSLTAHLQLISKSFKSQKKRNRLLKL